MLPRRPLLLAAASLAGCATLTPPVTLERTHQHDVTAADGVRRRVFVGVPAGPRPPQGWPVLLVLDGNALFPAALMLTRNLAQRANYQHALVIGLGYPATEGFDDAARARDYTPPAPGLAAGGRHGNADRFLDFVASEAAQLARAQGGDLGRQTLFGHSFGGLLVLHALCTRPGLFHTHVAASPSVWWHDRAILAGLAPLRQRLATGPARERLLLTVGSLEQTPPPGLAAERAAVMRKRAQLDGVRTLAAQLADLPGLQCQLRELPGETHGSAVLPALQRAIDLALGPRA